MIIDKLFKDLNLFYSYNYKEFSLINPFFIRNNNKLTWHNYLPFESFDNYIDYYLWVGNHRQYSIVADGIGIFQFYFFTDKNYIKEASLAFLPIPDISHQYFRVDYNSESNHDEIHPKGHIHYGYPSSFVRMLTIQIPFPSVFMYYFLRFGGMGAFSPSKDKIYSLNEKIFNSAFYFDTA